MNSNCLINTVILFLQIFYYHQILFRITGIVRMNKDYFVDETAIIGKNVKVGRYSSIHQKVKIGDNSKIEDGVVIYENCKIGKNCIIGTGAVLKPDTCIDDYSIFGTLSITEGKVKIGKCTTVHAQCHITKGVSIGSNTFIGPKLVTMNTPNITQGEHGTSNKKKSPKIFSLIIEDNVRIGSDVTIAPGIVVGHNSFIFVGTLITKDIPPFSIVKSGKDKVGKVVGKVQN